MNGSRDAADNRRWLLVLLFLACLLNYADRAIVAALADPIREEFGLSDLQLGLLQGLAFALLYATLGIPFARLAERRSRVRILAAATAIWSAMTIACGVAGNFIQLVIARVGVGVGEAGFSAPASSLIGDYFAKNERAFAVSLMMLGVPLGALVGGVGGGVLGASFGWRIAFILFGLPGLLLALLLLLTLKEPPRGRFDAPARDETPSLITVFGSAIASPLFRNVLAGGAFAALGSHALGAFLTVYFLRVHGLPLASAASYFGVITFVSVSIGMVAGGWIADMLGKRDPGWYALVPMIGTLCAAPIYIIAFAQSALLWSAALLLIANIFLILHYGPSLAMVQNFATARTRATLISIYLLAVNGLALALGPLLLGWASDLLTSQAIANCPSATDFCQAYQARGLARALQLVSVPFLLAAVFFLRARRFVG